MNIKVFFNRIAEKQSVKDVATNSRSWEKLPSVLPIGQRSRFTEVAL